MKTRFLTGILLLALSLTIYSCDDNEDYAINTAPIISSVQTGNAEVTAVSAIAGGSVVGLENQSPMAFTVGICYSTSEDPKTGIQVVGSLDKDGQIIATITGLQTNVTYHYCSFVVLQKKVIYYGDVKSFTTTSAVVTTNAATDVTAASASLSATLSGTGGITIQMGGGAKLGMTDNVEALKFGFDVPGTVDGSAINIPKKGLLPNTTYYYLPYLNLGSGYVYGNVKNFTTGNIESEFVDLGLSVMWATCNIGAELPEDLGGLFGWGELTGLQTSTDMGDYGVGANIFASSADIAHVHGLGRLPSANEIKELVNVCTTEWTTGNGVGGFRFTAPNGNSIFLPAAGYREEATIKQETAGGYYWTGSINESNSNFGEILSFTSSSAGAESVLRYQALSIRPVQKAPKEFKKELLHKTWLIDLDSEGKSYTFDGPLYYYGTDDSWTTVSDGDITTGDSWSWAPIWSENTWLAEARAYGNMTFGEDGTVVIDDFSNGTKYEGTYTVNETARTITLEGSKLLHISGFDGVVTNWSANLKILSLTENGLQIAVLRDNSDEGPCQLSFNYVSEDLWQMHQKKVYTASLCLYDGDGNNWGSYSNLINDEEGKQYVVTAETSRAAAQVFIFDIPNFASDYPNAIVRIDKIEVDGTAINYDANKFKYGNIEGNGTYRIELFNIWGAGTATDSPFGGGAKESEPALAFNNSFKVYFTILTLNGLEAELTCCDSNWNSSWPDAKVPMSVIGGFPQEYTVTYEGSRINGMINLIELQNFTTTVPNVAMTLKSVIVDGNSLDFDANKVKYGDLEGKGHYRIEIYNTYGGSRGNAAFEGETEEGTIPVLGFNSSMTVTFTLDKLF